MHAYSLDTNERRYVFLILAIVSIVLSWGFQQLLLKYHISLPWWVENPSVLFVYGILFLAFDKWLWKFFGKMNVSKTPNLNGEWEGSLKSSFDNHSGDIKVKLKIVQTWTEINILLRTDHSSSHSESASIINKAPEGIYLCYQYINDPKTNAAETMNIHRGTVRLLLNEKEKCLEGDYYSGRGRQNFGCLNFRRK